MYIDATVIQGILTPGWRIIAVDEAWVVFGVPIPLCVDLSDERESKYCGRRNLRLRDGPVSKEGVCGSIVRFLHQHRYLRDEFLGGL